MARSPYAWGIDIGKCALKAMRCRTSPGDPRKLVVEAFDYVEYPMMLTQPEADASELVKAALSEFMGRNDLRGDRIAVAVGGQAGLSKFIKLPPIEAKKIPDIVKYEARQQIPFPLDQVVWDWQRLAGGMEESGFVIDAEVALFAMKRDQVYKALAPLTAAGIEVDLLQLSPIALANMVVFDQLPDPKTVDPEKPTPSIVIVSMGVDSTDLVVTNGLRIWQRSLPIGGSSFTKALVKDLKLTFAKAEHLKRNAVRAEDPKAVFRSMRPVFNEFASELQRSLNYFTGSDRSATIGKVLMLGNATKLRGLSEYVAKHLQLDVQRPEKFDRLEGQAVLTAPAFRENRLAFATAYGLALQAAGGAELRTNLLPTEIVRDRLIEAKRPWAVAALAGLLVAALVNFAGVFGAWMTYAPRLYADSFAKADRVRQRAQTATADFEDRRVKRQESLVQQQPLVRVQERRFQALDMMRALETLLPHDEPGRIPEDPADRNEIHVERLDCQYFPDLAAWFTAVKKQWDETHLVDATTPAAAPQPPAADAPPPPAEGTPATPTGPKGPGWVIQVVGHHFHNEDRHKPNDAEQFVRSTLVRNILGQGPPVTVSAGPRSGQSVPPADVGIGFPVIVSSSTLKRIRKPRGLAPQRTEVTGQAAAPADEIELKQYDFVLQFAWQPTTTPPPAAAP